MASLIRRNWKTGPAWYIQYYVGNQQRRIHASNNFQIAKENSATSKRPRRRAMAQLIYVSRRRMSFEALTGIVAKSW
jgi:hypothetical protein